MKENKCFIEEALNVYRTKSFIVVQSLGIRYDDLENNTLYSFDTYYKRNKSRDKEYEHIFMNRRNIDGRRIQVSMYSRTYKD